MRAKDPVQLKESRVTIIFGKEIAPAVLVTQAGAQELAEIVGNIGSQAPPHQTGVEEGRGLVPAQSRIGPLIELPLAEEGIPKGLAIPGLEVPERNRSLDVRRLRRLRIGTPRKHQLAAEKEGFVFSKTKWFPTVHKINSMKICGTNTVIGRVIVAGPPQFQVVSIKKRAIPSQMSQVGHSGPCIRRYRYVSSAQNLERSVEAGIAIPGRGDEKIAGNSILNKPVFAHELRRR